MDWFNENDKLHLPSQSFVGNSNWMNERQYQEPSTSFPWSQVPGALQCSYCDSFHHTIQDCYLRIAYEGPQTPPPNPYNHSYNPYPTSYSPYPNHVTPPYTHYHESSYPPPNSTYNLDHPSPSYSPYHEPSTLSPHSQYPSPVTSYTSSSQTSPQAYYPPPSFQPSANNTSNLDSFLFLPNPDDQTQKLRAKYDILKVEWSRLIHYKVIDRISKWEEERFEEIGEFMRAFTQHVIWKKTHGQEGAPFPIAVDIKEEPNATPLVERSQASVLSSNPTTQGVNVSQEHLQPQEETLLTSGSIAPLLEEVDSPFSSAISLTVEATDCVSDDEVDEDIIVESPFQHEILHAHLASSSSSCLSVDTNCSSMTSLCDKHASLPCTSHDDDINSNELLPYSCDDKATCMNCLLIANCENFGEMLDASFSAGSAVISKHEIVENVEKIDECKHALSLKNYSNFHAMHTLVQLVWNDSMFLQVKISKRNESYHLILSCDLPPDLSCFLDYRIILHNLIMHKFSFSSTLLLPFSNECQGDVVYSNPELDSLPFTTHMFGHFEKQNSFLTSLARSHIDFVGCERQLLSNVPYFSLLTTNLFSCHIICINSFHGFKYFDSCGILGVGTTNLLVNYLQVDKRRLKLYFLLIFMSSYKPP